MLVNQIREVVHGLKRVSDNLQLDIPAVVHTDDELGEAARAFNSMQAQLADMIRVWVRIEKRYSQQKKMALIP